MSVRGFSSAETVPLPALVASFRATPFPGHIPDPRPALAELLGPAVLDSLPAAELADRLDAFADEFCPGVWHRDVLRTRAGLIRHSLAHLVRGDGPLSARYARCVLPGGTYFVPGLGRSFWGPVVAGAGTPTWRGDVELGLRRAGCLRDSRDAAADLAAACRIYADILARNPDWSADDVDAMFTAAAAMTGRELGTPPPKADPFARALRVVRVAVPLRKRLVEAAEPDAAEIRAHAAALDDALVPGLIPADADALFADFAKRVRDRWRVHPRELAAVLAEVAARPPAPPPRFRGFCTDTFRFLAGLAENNTREWMTANQPRYRFAVREPLLELGRILVDRYVRPVLVGEYGWDVQTDPRPGKAVTSICKNDYGQSTPYQPTLWLTFYPRAAASRRFDVQFFVRVDADGVRYGFLLGRAARDPGRRFRHAVQHYAGELFNALAATAATDSVTFAHDDLLETSVPVRTPDDLRGWAAGRVLVAGRCRKPDDPMLRAEELVGEVLLTFDRLVPLFAAASDADPLPVLARRAGVPGVAAYDDAAFERDTLLPGVWLDRVRGLLAMKKQLVLHGPPGTGKTHAARHLANLLARGTPDAVRFVQFHPGYGYADFVEGTAGDGVLVAFATRAAVRPSQTFVLVIDELTRGHLPTVFGELFSLLEYRGETLTLPHSKREFRLPDNLVILSTAGPPGANDPDPGPALRRRFGFVEMPPDAGILSRYFAEHPPADTDPTFGPRAVKLFEDANARIARDFGRDRRVGHTAFMVPDLDADKLRAVWDHHVLPGLADALAGSPAHAAGYAFDRLFRPDRPPTPVPA